MEITIVSSASDQIFWVGFDSHSTDRCPLRGPWDAPCLGIRPRFSRRWRRCEL